MNGWYGQFLGSTGDLPDCYGKRLLVSIFFETVMKWIGAPQY